MWNTKNTKLSWLILALIFLGIMSCSEQESDIHLFYGEWSVREARWTNVNGISGPNFIQNYIMELNAENCGAKYNLDKEETATIKWLFNEGDDMYDHHFLLSVRGSSIEGISNLARDNLYLVMQLSEKEIVFSRSETRMSNDTTFKTIWNLRLNKE